MARVRIHEEVLTTAGAPAIVRHLRLSGSNAAIGRELAELAVRRHGLRAESLVSDARYVRARRSYVRRDYPVHLQRMRGVAAAFDLRLDDDRFDFSLLPLGGRQADARILQGDARYSPPSTTRGGGSLRRSAQVAGYPDEPLELYLMEWHPTGAPYVSLAVHVGDLLAGAIEGINAAGLAIAAVAAGRPDPTTVDRRALAVEPVRAIGLHELQLVRLVLDSCRTVDDAQAALLAAREFTLAAPARYLVADRDGRSFVYEPSADRRMQRIVDGAVEAQAVASSSGRTEPDAWQWRCVVDQAARSLEVSLRAPKAFGRPQVNDPPDASGEQSGDLRADTLRLAAAI